MFITVTDIRRHHCITGTRRWFAANNLDFRAFIQNGGIEADELLATGDALAIAVVEDAVRRREENPNG